MQKTFLPKSAAPIVERVQGRRLTPLPPLVCSFFLFVTPPNHITPYHTIPSKFASVSPYRASSKHDCRQLPFPDSFYRSVASRCRTTSSGGASFTTYFTVPTGVSNIQSVFRISQSPQGSRRVCVLKRPQATETHTAMEIDNTVTAAAAYAGLPGALLCIKVPNTCLPNTLSFATRARCGASRQ